MVEFLKRNYVSRLSSRINIMKNTACMQEDFYTNSKVCPVYLEQNLCSCKNLKDLEWHLTKLKSVQTISLLRKKEKQK